MTLLFTLILLITALLIVAYLFLVNNKGSEEFNDGLTHIEKIKLMQSMLAVHEVFEKHNIWYIISFGTLLGSVRHKNIIPWDDDIDLLVKFEDINKIRSALKELEKMGLKVEETYKLFRIYSDDKHFIDLFIISSENNKIMRCYSDQKICKYPEASVGWWHNYFGFHENFVQNRKLYQYGSLYLWGPMDSWNLLRFWYGDDFLTICKSHYLKNHEEHIDVIKEKCPQYSPPQF
jgi:hypothetical protein